MLFGRYAPLEFMDPVELLSSLGRLFTNSRGCKGLPSLSFGLFGLGNLLLSLIDSCLGFLAFLGDVSAQLVTGRVEIIPARARLFIIGVNFIGILMVLR